MEQHRSALLILREYRAKQALCVVLLQVIGTAGEKPPFSTRGSTGALIRYRASDFSLISTAAPRY